MLQVDGRAGVHLGSLRIGPAGIESRDPLPDIDGFGVPLQPRQRDAEVKERAHVFGIELERALEGLEGLGVALIGTLLAETKLSNRGMGYLIIQAYSTFDMPKMYALLIVLFVLAIGANALIGRLGGLDDIKRR